MYALDSSLIEQKYNNLSPFLSEVGRRVWAATEAEALGYGGISMVSRATGLSRTTIKAGLKELSEGSAKKAEKDRVDLRVRRTGGGRKAITYNDPGVIDDLELLITPYTRGDPMRPLRWTSKSTYKLSDELKAKGHSISARSVAKLLHSQGYSLQSNRKRYEGNQHPDRDGQFKYINQMAMEFQQRALPVISVDTKKKELIGLYNNEGKEWTPKENPIEVNAYDFIDTEKGKAIPYGVYDESLNLGWVNIGIDHDTAEFAVESIRRWWSHMGEYAYPKARELLIFADGGGSNGSRNRLWKYSLQKLANELEMKIVICHFPPGTSKWNKIEHRMFSHITKNWRGKPLISHEVMVQLIGSTTTSKGLTIKAQVDKNTYPKGKKISDEQMDSINLQRAEFHGEWNYMIAPSHLAN